MSSFYCVLLPPAAEWRCNCTNHEQVNLTDKFLHDLAMKV